MVRKMNINHNKLCLLVLVSTVLYNEYLSYWLSHLSWSHLSSGQHTVLMVADPQIVGNLHEPEGVLGWIRRVDCDRYLSKTYQWALSSYDINTVIFMGDLIDEGSEADDELYEAYVERFRAVYPVRDDIKMIYIPGDNDIGGEGADPVTINKIDRFARHFGPVSAVYAASESLDIVPVSRLTEHGVYNLSLVPAQLFTTKIVVTVSHVPVLPLNGRFSERVMNLINPDIIFSAHDHLGYKFTADRETRHMQGNIERFSRLESQVTRVDTRHGLQAEDADLGVGRLKEEVVEIVVPTASYRMGVPNMGLGLVSISGQGSVEYTNLWLPSRFSLLYTYAASLVITVIIFSLGKCLHLRRLIRRKQDHSSEARRKYDTLLKL